MQTLPSITELVDVENIESIINVLQDIDRHQGSVTIGEACHVLLAMVTQRNVRCSARIIKFPLDRRTQCLGFDLPPMWTLSSARVSLYGPEELLTLTQQNNPMLIATHSAAHHGRANLVDFKSHQNFEGRVVLYAGTRTDFSKVIAKAVDSHATGIATSCFSKSVGGKQARGRIELPPDSKIFALSLLPSEMRQLELGLENAKVVFNVDIDARQTGWMPVVELSLDSDDPREYWLTAHVCHPRPSANDNASGVAVAIEIYRMLCLLQADGFHFPSIRILLSPEFVGMAAYLSTISKKPCFVINIDTVGGDIGATGAKLELELAPNFMSAPQQVRLRQLIEANAIALSPQTCTTIPFVGYSDHALFASHGINVPAVQFGQSSDPYNHTDLDRIDNLSLPQLRWLVALITQYLHEEASSHDPPPASCTLANKTYQAPFNIRRLLPMLNEEDRQFVENNFASRKTTFRDLQYIWLLFQRETSIKTIMEKIIDVFPDTDRTTMERYVKKIADVTPTRLI
ncbi:DUF4910 domain-containing protein [Dyella choica]|nr:DUF4910 domain-containing protein [Dyella choica]